MTTARGPSIDLGERRAPVQAALELLLYHWPAIPFAPETKRPTNRLTDQPTELLLMIRSDMDTNAIYRKGEIVSETLDRS